MALARRNKYGARRTVVADLSFASALEGNHYRELLLRERAGEITDIKPQVSFPLFTVNDAGERVPVMLGSTRKRQSVYVADFTYVTTRDNVLHVIECKGFDVPLGRLKRAIVEAATGKTIELVKKR